MDWLREYWHWMKTAMDVVKWVAVLTIMTGRSNPSYKMAWIILILAFPVAGITIYLLFGGNRISNRENRRMNRVEVMVAQHLRQDQTVMQALEREDIPAWNHARYLLSSSRYPVYDNSAAVYFPSGESCYARMLEELEKAEHYIFLEFFIINNGKMWDSILEVLHRKAMQGVDVRVLYDDFGCITRLPMRYCKKLREMGIEAHVFNPFIPVLSGRLNNRDHRKLMLIDGKVGFTGGVNLADEYINEIERFGHWKDCGILVRRRGRLVDGDDVPQHLGLCRGVRGRRGRVPAGLSGGCKGRGLFAAVCRQPAGPRGRGRDDLPEPHPVRLPQALDHDAVSDSG